MADIQKIRIKETLLDEKAPKSKITKAKAKKAKKSTQAKQKTTKTTKTKQGKVEQSVVVNVSTGKGKRTRQPSAKKVTAPSTDNVASRNPLVNTTINTQVADKNITPDPIKYLETKDPKFNVLVGIKLKKPTKIAIGKKKKVINPYDAEIELQQEAFEVKPTAKGKGLAENVEGQTKVKILAGKTTKLDAKVEPQTQFVENIAGNTNKTISYDVEGETNLQTNAEKGIADEANNKNLLKKITDALKVTENKPKKSLKTIKTTKKTELEPEFVENIAGNTDKITAFDTQAEGTNEKNAEPTKKTKVKKEKPKYELIEEEPIEEEEIIPVLKKGRKPKYATEEERKQAQKESRIKSQLTKKGIALEGYARGTIPTEFPSQAKVELVKPDLTKTEKEFLGISTTPIIKETTPQIKEFFRAKSIMPESEPIFKGKTDNSLNKLLNAQNESNNNPIKQSLNENINDIPTEEVPELVYATSNLDVPNISFV
jgi:hypothetical protein